MVQCDLCLGGVSSDVISDAIQKNLGYIYVVQCDFYLWDFGSDVNLDAIQKNLSRFV